jgi:hypothetical protein
MKKRKKKNQQTFKVSLPTFPHLSLQPFPIPLSTTPKNSGGGGRSAKGMEQGMGETWGKGDFATHLSFFIINFVVLFNFIFIF